MAKAYTEARKQHGDSELLDEIAATKPEMDRARAGSPDELKQHNLDNVRQAISVLKTKASDEEVEEYRKFILGLGERVAEARKEGFMGLSGERVSDAERAAISDIDAAPRRLAWLTGWPRLRHSLDRAGGSRQRGTSPGAEVRAGALGAGTGSPGPRRAPRGAGPDARARARRRSATGACSSRRSPSTAAARCDHGGRPRATPRDGPRRRSSAATRTSRTSASSPRPTGGCLRHQRLRRDAARAVRVGREAARRELRGRRPRPRLRRSRAPSGRRRTACRAYREAMRELRRRCATLDVWYARLDVERV